MILAGITWTLILYSLLNRLPTPKGAQGDFYGQLVSTVSMFQVSMLSLVSLGLALMAPSAHWPLWWVLATSFAVLVWVDFRTTFLPSLLQFSGTAQLLLGLFACYFWLELLVQDVIRAVLGALAAYLLYLVIWRLAKGNLGFGDVRLAGAVSLVTAAHSWELWWTGIFASSVIGAFWALVAGRRGQSFPYGPALYLGAFAALLLTYFTDSSA